jgi:hypothetical protein
MQSMQAAPVPPHTLSLFVPATHDPFEQQPPLQSSPGPHGVPQVWVVVSQATPIAHWAEVSHWTQPPNAVTHTSPMATQFTSLSGMHSPFMQEIGR